MSAPADPASDERSAEARAEDLMERVTGEASRLIGRFVGRAREELEDLVAEARSLNAGPDHRSALADSAGTDSAGRRRSRPD